MSTFDGWEDQLYGDVMALPPGNELMHFRTKGSKNGVRRYQMPDGTWTPLGLKERKAREGWGESRAERKAAKRVAKSERKAAKAEKKSAKVMARKERRAALREKLRKNDVSKLSDEELKKRIERVKMEQEYKELTRSPILKSGEKIVSGIMESREKKAARAEAKAKMELDNNRVLADIIKAREQTKRAKADASKAKEERKKVAQDRKAGLAYARKAELRKAKTEYRGTTIRGGIARRLNVKMTAGLKEKYTAKRKAEGEAKAKRILSDSAYDLKKRKAQQEYADSADYRKRMNAYEKEDRKRQKKNQKQYQKDKRRLARKAGGRYTYAGGLDFPVM